jgi:MFS family permease
MALPSFVVCICFPLIGWLSDKFNKRGTSLVIATLISSSTQLYIILLPFSNRSTHILAPLVLNQLGYAIFITNVWPGLSNLLRFTHPDEFKDLEEDEEDENENDSDMSRSNFAIGIMSSLINVGNGVQPLILGAILDASKMVTGGEDNFEKGIKKVCLLMCVLDGIAAICLLMCVILKPHMLNGH